jgi:hypothetical protein|tara:strand:- start:121 stop:678 length:558 start_codon:yes stop_codon:yes gene_type:complete
MIEFKKTINTLKFSLKFDKDLPRQFLKKIFKDATINANYIQEQIKISAGIDIPVTKINSHETSIAIIGVSLALLQKHSALMSSKQGKKVELLCKKSIEKDFGLVVQESELMIKGIDEYIKAYNDSWDMKTNPFNRPAGILLAEFAGKDVDKIFQKEHPELINELTHKMTMTALLSLTFEPMKIFK